MKVLNIPLFKKQQEGINTDCSFVFRVSKDDGKTFEEKTINAHKFILTNVSPYFEAQFKSEWNGNEPIPVTTFQHETFEKLIEVIYLSSVSFGALDEATNLYEAAQFYQIEGLLDLLRDEIPIFWMAHKTIKISRMVNTILKYQDWMLMQFIVKCFCTNAPEILEDEDWLNYTPAAINFLYLKDDISTTESNILKALERFVKHHETVSIKTLKPAIEAIRFNTLSDDEIGNTALLTQAEKVIFLKHKVVQNKEGRKEKPFYFELSPETQTNLSELYSTSSCWICKAAHSPMNCTSTNNTQFYATYPYTSISIQQQSKHIILNIMKHVTSKFKPADIYNEFKNSFHVRFYKPPPVSIPRGRARPLI